MCCGGVSQCWAREEGSAPRPDVAGPVRLRMLREGRREAIAVWMDGRMEWMDGAEEQRSRAEQSRETQCKAGGRARKREAEVSRESARRGRVG